MTRVAIVALLLVVQADATAKRIEETRLLVAELMTGRTSGVTKRLDDKVKTELPPARLHQALVQVRAEAGPFLDIGEVRSQARDGLLAVVVTCEFANGPWDVLVVWSSAGRIVGLNLRPAATPTEYHAPAYVEAERFTATEVTVDAGTGWPLAGTLTMPRGGGPFPAVVLVHGSGPQDRDASLPPNKIFRDLAEGLSSRGVAVLRYDKRTAVHRSRTAALQDFTVNEETIEDALAAVALLRQTALVRADRIFVAGHSLGGTLAPRIAAADPALAGLVILAGAVRPLEDTIVSQLRYLAEVDGTVSDDERRLIADAGTFARRAKTIKRGDPPLHSPLASGPASYIVDLRGYDPPSAAKTLPQRMLVLQGERDYQVTMDDFAAWKAALAGRSNVQFQSFPTLNHLFLPGTGPSVPSEYRTEGHVDEAVIGAIAGWIGQ